MSTSSSFQFRDRETSASMRTPDRPPWRIQGVAQSILLSRVALYSVLCSALALFGVGVWSFTHPINQHDIDRSAAATTLMDMGRSVRADIARVVRPAMERTRKQAADPDIIDALRSGNAERQTRACNTAISASTEIDAFALFDHAGRIVAINTEYASGEPIPQERVDRIMRLSFDNRDIIQKCARNESNDAALEFQTTCDITPAFFDSSGLSVAYSVPVFDPDTGEKLGVASARLRFERVTDLIRSRTADDPNCVIEFVTDRGEYFSEEIASGRSAPPVRVDELSVIVASAAKAHDGYRFVRHADSFLSLFQLQDFVTLDGGGIHVLVVADERWLGAIHVPE